MFSHGYIFIYCWLNPVKRKVLTLFIWFILKIYGVVYAFVPSVLIVIFNILLFNERKSSKKRISHSYTSQQKIKIKSDLNAMVKTQMLFSLVFIVITLPRSITLLIYFKTPNDFNNAVSTFFELISYIYFNSSFLLLLIQNKPFKEQFIKEIVVKVKKKKALFLSTTTLGQHLDTFNFNRPKSEIQ